MLGSLKRKRIERERMDAVGERERAARDFVAAIREAEAALDAIRDANDKLYRSDVQAEQLALDDLRRARERMFAFVVAKEVVAEAPVLARALCVRVAPTQMMPFVDFINHTSALDFSNKVVPIEEARA
ncbi:MAG TPA: hypothetical protein VJM34_16435 [Novosphingobium sp.]|nr:hypothetical protein [Novosphingobium sp.]